MNKIDHPTAVPSIPAASTNAAQATEVRGVAETALQPALSEQDRQWRRENREAIDCYDEWIAAHGLPLEEFRDF